MKLLKRIYKWLQCWAEACPAEVKYNKKNKQF